MLSIELRGVEETRARLQNVPPSLRRNLQRRIEQEAEPIVSEAKASAARYSTRIPRSFRVETKFGLRTAGVRIRASSKIAPHARINEFGGRHPIPNTQKWAYQPPRPNLFPAARRRTTAVRAGVQRAIDDTVHEF